MPAHEIALSAIRDIVGAGSAAPALSGGQPWRFWLRGDIIEVHADPKRGAGVDDPHGRAAHLGCGSAIYNLRVAIAAHGREPIVRLRPRNHEPSALAVLRIAGPHRITAADIASYEAIWWHHRDPSPLEERQIPTEIRREMEEAARMEGALLVFARGGEKERLLDLLDLDAAKEREAADPPGVPRMANEDGDRGGERRFRLGSRWRGRTRSASRLPLALLHTQTNDTVDWLRAGQALQRAALVGTIHGLAMSFLTQPWEREDLEAETARWRGGRAWQPQAMFHVGYSREQRVAAPRQGTDLALGLERPAAAGSYLGFALRSRADRPWGRVGTIGGRTRT